MVIVLGGPDGALAEVRQRIAAACQRAGRQPEEVVLIAVTKKVPGEMVRRAAEAGFTDFGENYVQELERKRQMAPRARWHFVGRLQRNKVRRVLEVADVIHGLEPGSAAEHLAVVARDRDQEPVDCLIEVDFTGRRVGVAPEEVDAFVDRMAGEPGIALRGLMTIPPEGEPSRGYFARLRKMRDRLGARVETLRDLSMGMSADYELAVEEGATMVRVGTAIFGPRP